jgi:poly-gamma-glutamate capsule biosynthesis protein CapA/YwtB (metallophosphatase superfamily)
MVIQGHPRVEEMLVRNALKGVGAALAVIALCTPFIFWTFDDAQPHTIELSQATVTVPPVVMVETTVSPSEMTTTTTEKPVEPLEPTTTTTTTEAPITITIAAVGDIIPHRGILDSVDDPETGVYDFWPVFSPIAPYLMRADYTIGNLETRVAGEDYGYTGYPLFNSPDELLDTLGRTGIDLLATANNHALDKGWDGIVATLDRLDAAGIAHVGTYRSMAEKKIPFVVDIDGVKVAFLNYTDWLNGLEPPKEQEDYAVNVLDVDAVAEDAAIARMWGAEIVVAMLHYGKEYQREPSEEQIKASQGTEDYEGLLSRGVDVIIGAHSHVVQPIVHLLQWSSWSLPDTYVAYSLGNFVSAQRDRYTDSGLIAYIHIEKRNQRAYVTGISYLPVYVQRSTVQEPVRYRILPVLPGLEPETDAPLTAEDEERMNQVWEELNEMLYRPNEDIEPLVPADLGIG